MMDAPEKIFTVEDLVDESDERPRNNVANALHRLMTNENITRASHGRYQANINKV